MMPIIEIDGLMDIQIYYTNTTKLSNEEPS